MRGHDRQDDELEEFIAARTQDLHHDAYQLTAAQESAEELVTAVLADMQRERIDLAQAGSTARLRMARACARDNTPTRDSDASQLAARFRPLARLSPRQRAALVLRVVDGYDDRETARNLQLTSRATTEALDSVPYDELPGATPNSGELRSLLEEFGDLAISPSASTTLADIRAVPPPPRRPWWTHVAAFLVIALTIASVVISQRRHDEWIHSPIGLNHEHGTHFQAYTRGYRLVGIDDVQPGPAAPFDLGTDDAVAIECAQGQRGQTAVGRLMSQLIGVFAVGCSAPRGDVHLVPARGATVVTVDNFKRGHWPMAVYRKVPWDQYPVTTKGFIVENDETLLTSGDSAMSPSSAGSVLTLHAHPAKPNGTFTGRLAIPDDITGTDLVVSGLLSPTTTGRFRVTVDRHTPWRACGRQDVVNYAGRTSTWCEFFDRRVPQVPFTEFLAPPAGARTVPVTITVEHARGPWTLQVVAERYKLDNGAVDDAGSAPR